MQARFGRLAEARSNSRRSRDDIHPLDCSAAGAPSACESPQTRFGAQILCRKHRLLEAASWQPPFAQRRTLMEQQAERPIGGPANGALNTFGIRCTIKKAYLQENLENWRRVLRDLPNDFGKKRVWCPIWAA